MIAERLREAAKVLRERAEAARSAWGDEPWGFIGLGWNDVQGQTYDVGVVVSDETDYAIVAAAGAEEVATYIATMHPGVGLALADWLDTAGADLWAHGPLCDCGSGCTACDDDAWQPHVRRALALADLILGGTP